LYLPFFFVCVGIQQAHILNQKKIAHKLCDDQKKISHPHLRVTSPLKGSQLLCSRGFAFAVFLFGGAMSSGQETMEHKVKHHRRVYFTKHACIKILVVKQASTQAEGPPPSTEAVESRYAGGAVVVVVAAITLF
jgi:hypothetical protein